MNLEKYNTLVKYCEDHQVQLVAVSKTKPNEDILQLYAKGQRVFGENKVQEMTTKAESLPKDIQWHMIGHLQSNKVKYIVDFVSLIHSGDRISVIKEINKQAKKINRPIDILLQIKIADEDSKFGWDYNELNDQFEKILSYSHIQLKGVMGMATFTDDTNQIRAEFKRLKTYFDELKSKVTEPDKFTIISMGMSGDYEIAVEEGANMIRVGSLLFGARNYDV